jgi:hypothetical protein
LQQPCNVPSETGWIDNSAGSLTVTLVNRFVRIVALLLAVFWMPLTSHCNLEQLPGLQFLACGDQSDQTPHTNTGCGESACASVESGLYKTEERPNTLPASALLPVFGVAAAMDTLPQMAQLRANLEFAPPELSRGWQFHFRTALPPRAPSLAS